MARLARVVVPTGQAQIGPNASARVKPSRIVQHQAVRECDHGSDAAHLSEAGSLGVLLFAELLDLPVEEPDLLREMTDGLQHRLELGP